MQFHESSTRRKFIQKAIKIKFYRVFIDENLSYSKQPNKAEYRNRLTINLYSFLFTRQSRVLRNIFEFLKSSVVMWLLTAIRAQCCDDEWIGGIIHHRWPSTNISMSSSTLKFSMNEKKFELFYEHKNFPFCRIFSSRSSLTLKGRVQSSITFL